MSTKVNFVITTKLLADKKNIQRMLENKFPDKIKNYFTQNNKNKTYACCFGVKKTDNPEMIESFLTEQTSLKFVTN